ncbi:MAG: pyridoxamine 5'-phosphate oxidase family protein [Balneolaceae bacterium]
MLHPDNEPSALVHDLFGELRLALNDRNHPFRFCTFCTTDSVGRPDCRMVVLRGVEKQSRLLFYTDARSRKTGQIRENPHVCLLFWHPQKQVQLRLYGSAKLHTGNDTAARHWETVTGGARHDYNLLHPPGTPVDDPASGRQLRQPLDDRYFTVVVCTLFSLHALQLHADGHRAIEASAPDNGSDWIGEWISP